MKKSEILDIIKEEVEVVLTNAEMIEIFDLDPVKLLDEMMNENPKLGQDRVTQSARKRYDRDQVQQGLGKEVTPRETGIIQSVEKALTSVAKRADLYKYKVILQQLLNKLQKRTGGTDELNEAEGKGCAESEGGPGCIKKQDDQWVIMNNKKGGVWRKCDSEAHCEEILDAFHASKG